ncbi:MAG: tRNA (adenosine(37)-N6)-threonylcarbamoyltransferase complex dimerization subunit type 1 TsaB [Deltaproteobacteria bacterium]|nr:tRNA (adenosine(37)-N6)-threonylcarbamoyltransferase complex dimerization subunit type 1 TsaB [Deltaproteobacteria bacterium]
MKLLAIDTSTASGSIAIVEDGRLVAESTLHIKKTHAERLLPSLDHLLKVTDTSIEGINRFAVTVGPGSFTGLRIGVSTVKGLAWTLKKPVVGVSTLEALASNIPYSNIPICPVLDARKREVYTAIYRWGVRASQEVEGMEREMEESAIRPEELVTRVKGPTIFLGDGLGVYGDMIKDNLGDLAIIAPSYLWHIRAAIVGWIGWLRFNRGLVDSPEVIRPFYIRPSEAEIKAKSFI